MLKIKKSNDIYSRCIWCGKKENVYEIRFGKKSFVMEICVDCINEIQEKVK